MKSKISHFLIVLFIGCLFQATPSFAQPTDKIDHNSVISYILSCQKGNGAFGPKNMDYTDLAWTYPAVHALKLLGAEIPSPDSVYLNGGKPWIEKANWKNGPWYWSLHQRANLYQVLDAKGDLEEGFSQGHSMTLQFRPRRSYMEARNYLDGYFFDMASLWNVAEAVTIMNGKINNPDEISAYIVARQSEKGGFDDMLGNQAQPDDLKAHILITHDAVMTLKVLGLPVPGKERLVKWVRECQDPQGGFRWNPENNSYSNQPDVMYTWAAIRILNALGESPESVDQCIKWMNSLQNADGGFADRPGWSSRLYSTFYAIQSLDLLTGNLEEAITEKIPAEQKQTTIPDGEFSIFQAHHKSPSGGQEMVDSVVALGLHLVGVKTTEKEVVSSDGMSKIVSDARAYASEKNYAIEILDCPENYAHRLEWFSGMRGDHCSNILLPPGLTGNDWNKYLEAYNEGLKGHSWEDYKQKVIDPMLDFETLFYPELDYTMMNAYMVYDDGLDGNTGYNAVPAAHFGNYDWVRHFPYKERWLGQLPMIADGDAHGDIYKWKPNLESYRNVFIARSYHYSDYIDASLNGRSVCVIRMPESGEVRYYGAEPAIEYLQNHFDEWKWW